MCVCLCLREQLKQSGKKEEMCSKLWRVHTYVQKMQNEMLQFPTSQK